MITPDYVVGIIDGEGCFEILFGKNSMSKLGFYIRPEFRINLQDDDLLRKIRDFLGVGGVYKVTKQGYSAFIVVAINDLEKLRKFLIKNPPLLKRKQFETWCKAVDTYRQMKTKNILEKKERFLELVKLREKLNLMPKRRKFSMQEIEMLINAKKSDQIDTA